jgi:hypothetical protein
MRMLGRTVLSLLIATFSFSAMANEKCGQVIGVQPFSDDSSAFLVFFEKLDDDERVGLAFPLTTANLILASHAVGNTQIQLCFDENNNISIRSRQ